MKLSIVVPCYNEEKNIPLIVEKFSRICEGRNDVEVILVNNGSTDSSAGVFEERVAQYPSPALQVVTVKTNIGYGHGIVTGLRAATGDVLAWTHADLQTDPADAIRAFEKFRSFSDPARVMIKGKRIKRSFGQWGFTFGMSCIASALLGGVYYDINAQPKLFHRSLFEKMTNPPDDFSLDLYLLYIAKNNGVRLHTIPVTFNKRIHGESKWAFSFSSKWKTILRTIRYIFALRRSVTMRG